MLVCRIHLAIFFRILNITIFFIDVLKVDVLKVDVKSEDFESVFVRYEMDMKESCCRYCRKKFANDERLEFHLQEHNFYYSPD